MIYQVTTPVFVLGLLTVLAAFLPSRTAALLWRSGLAILLALAAMASLAHNERQVLLTRTEQALRDVIKLDAATLAARGRYATHYLVFLDDKTRWFASDTLSPVYASTWFPGGAATFRLVPSPLYEALQPGPPVTFLDDTGGVAAATSDGRQLPYERIRFVVADSGRFTVQDRVSADVVAGFRARWHRQDRITPSR
jgi:hypothetical protein